MYGFVEASLSGPPTVLDSDSLYKMDNTHTR